MNKVLVIGCPGSGKTHFSQRLAELTDLPLIHLDRIYHQDIWDQDPSLKKEQWRAAVGQIVAAERWIIDGNYKSTFDIRFPAADTIVFLDYPRWLALSRAFYRQWKYRKTRRPDMPPEWRERMSPDFLRFLWTYRRQERPQVLQILHQCRADKTVYVFDKPDQASHFWKIFRDRIDLKPRRSPVTPE